MHVTWQVLDLAWKNNRVVLVRSDVKSVAQDSRTRVIGRRRVVSDLHRRFRAGLILQAGTIDGV